VAGRFLIEMFLSKQDLLSCIEPRHPGLLLEGQLKLKHVKFFKELGPNYRE
jgi:hypothetical protein